MSFGFFAVGIAAERPFADESAYFSQAYFVDHLIGGEWNHPDWLEYPAYDLPPLPKYLIGGTLRATGFRYPAPPRWLAWYRDTSTRFDAPGALMVARIPSVLLGAVGCMAVFGLGCMAFDRRAGYLASLLLMLNPLYQTHARRAMSDVPAEAFTLLALVLALWAWRRMLQGRTGGVAWLVPVLAGVSCGLAVLSKFSGALAILVMAGWVALAWILPGYSVGRKLAVAVSFLVAGMVSFATFVGLDPFVTARLGHGTHPELQRMSKLNLLERCSFLVAHRRGVSDSQREIFPSYALQSPRSKIEAVLVQGYGRFGPLGPRRDDSRVRFDWSQDAGAVIWLPLVCAGAFWAVARGIGQIRAGDPPTALAVAVQAVLSWAVVTAYLPLAWDRYYLPLQAGSVLLASGAIAGLVERLARGRNTAGRV